MKQLRNLFALLLVSSCTPQLRSSEPRCPCIPQFMKAFNNTNNNASDPQITLQDAAGEFDRCQAPRIDPCRCVRQAGAASKKALGTNHAIPSLAVAARLAVAVRNGKEAEIKAAADQELLPATQPCQLSQTSDAGDSATSHALLAYEIQPSCPTDALLSANQHSDEGTQKLLAEARSLMEQQQYEAAQKIYTQIIDVDKNNYDAHRNLATIARAQEKFSTARMHIQTALASRPGNSCLQRELAFLSIADGDIAAARTFYTEVIKQTNDPASKCALAYTYKLTGNIDESITRYKAIIAEHPEYPAALYSLAKALLIKGDHAQGYEQLLPFLRASDPLYTEKTDELRALWKNGPVSGKTIVLHATPRSGQGDSLEFIPFYERLLREAGNRVIVVAPKSLVSLFSRTMQQVQTADQPLPAHDYIVSAMSAPAVFNTTQPNTNEAPRLRAHPDHVAERAQQMAQREEQLGNVNALKVAFCWQADVNNDKSRLPIGRRSIIPLDPLKDVVTMPGTSFYSLLLDNSALAQVPWGDTVYQFSGDFDKTHGAYEDTAAVITNSDLVISVDTSILHLAASLGKEVWAYLPPEADFRWQQNGETVWYDKNKVKIFRSKEALQKALAERVRLHQLQATALRSKL